MKISIQSQVFLIKVQLIYFLVSKQIQKQSPGFLLQSIGSEKSQYNSRKINIGFFFVFAKVYGKTLNVSENAFFIYVLIEVLLIYREK